MKRVISDGDDEIVRDDEIVSHIEKQLSRELDKNDLGAVKIH